MLIIEFHNVTELSAASSYHYEVRINDRVIESGHIAGHYRSEGWRALANQLVNRVGIHVDAVPYGIREKAADRLGVRPPKVDAHLGSVGE